MRSWPSWVAACLALFVLLLAVGGAALDAQDEQGPAPFLWKPPWKQRGDCGPISLFALLKLEDRNVTLREVEERLRMDPVHGCSLESLAQVSKALGLPVEVRYVNPAEVTKVPRPFILHGIAEKKANTGHFVVVVDYDQRRRNLTVIDPVRERLLVVPLDSLLVSYSGYVLVPKENKEQRWSRWTGVVALVGGSILVLSACVQLMWKLTSTRRRTGNPSQDSPIDGVRA